MSGAPKKLNGYVREFRGAYSEIPKAVFAALAFSLAVRLAGIDDDAEPLEPGDEPLPVEEQALQILWLEWNALHANGIVPQKPREVTR